MAVAERHDPPGMELRRGGLGLVGTVPRFVDPGMTGSWRSLRGSSVHGTSAKAAERGLEVDFLKKDKTVDALVTTSSSRMAPRRAAPGGAGRARLRGFRECQSGERFRRTRHRCGSRRRPDPVGLSPVAPVATQISCAARDRTSPRLSAHVLLASRRGLGAGEDSAGVGRPHDAKRHHEVHAPLAVCEGRGSGDA